ncbi:hypothetical protein CASFOL_035265 [Castilleja foliolosa]|uniref:Uncharacterized protein n=1 Tax=Castilleja foliolosa TaxID=1961234 RepID=A0ABD3BS42_9LAMI
MATSIFHLLLVFLLAATASARPCKNLFYFTTTTTTTYYPFNSFHRNPNSNSLFFDQNPRYLSLVLTTTASRFPILRPSLDSVSEKSSDEDSRSSHWMMTTPSNFPLKFYTAVSSSIRDWSREIMTVVAALAAMLLGAGCGALTAAAVYFVYALITHRRRSSVDFDDVDSSDEDDDFTISKKFSYLPIPADDLKKPAPPAKEVV